jgi:dipeptidyl aminopeptidase/acylaminoacyl peptidase
LPRPGASAPPWIRSLQFIENSPIFWVEKVNTPYLTIANDEDDAVPWYQGIEFFSALRRLGKKVVWLRYHDGAHGGPNTNDERKNMYKRMLEWYDKYLKDEKK